MKIYLSNIYKRKHNKNYFPPFVGYVEGRNLKEQGLDFQLSNVLFSRHAGRMWAEGEVNEGATFYFSLP